MREIKIIKEYISRLKLDLSDLVLLTEAGSGGYIFSPLIALMSGAKRVVAISPDSNWATHVDTKQRIKEYMDYLGVEANRINLVRNIKESVNEQFDIFLNLGFVRPIDEKILAYANNNAVVGYMCESWEWRDGDVDIEECRRKSIPIVGVNENFGDFKILDSCGQLLIKMLFEAGQEVATCQYIVIGDEHFGEIARNTLKNNNASCVLVRNAQEISMDTLHNSDALITADYTNKNNIMSNIRWKPEKIKEINPNLDIIQFAGHIDVDEFINAGIRVYPPSKLPPQKMAKTLEHLGPRPVIGLHCLGMKAAEIVHKKITNTNFDQKYESLIHRIL
jgi:hypothetical protein